MSASAPCRILNLAPFLVENKSLRFLSIRGERHEISGAGLTRLADALSSNETLETLAIGDESFDRRTIGAQGLAALGRILARHLGLYRRVGHAVSSLAGGAADFPPLLLGARGWGGGGLAPPVVAAAAAGGGGGAGGAGGGAGARAGHRIRAVRQAPFWVLSDYADAVSYPCLDICYSVDREAYQGILRAALVSTLTGGKLGIFSHAKEEFFSDFNVTFHQSSSVIYPVLASAAARLSMPRFSDLDPKPTQVLRYLRDRAVAVHRAWVTMVVLGRAQRLGLFPPSLFIGEPALLIVSFLASAPFTRAQASSLLMSAQKFETNLSSGRRGEVGSGDEKAAAASASTVTAVAGLKEEGEEEEEEEEEEGKEGAGDGRGRGEGKERERGEGKRSSYMPTRVDNQLERLGEEILGDMPELVDTDKSE